MRATPFVGIIPLLLMACGKPMWRSPLPTVSDQPRVEGEAIETGVYALLLAEGPEAWDHPLQYPAVLAESTVVIDSSASDSVDPPSAEGHSSWIIKNRWPDSVRAGFAAALADYGRQSRERHAVPATALTGSQVRFGTAEMPDCMAERTPECRRVKSWVAVSPIGFNRDSTYAIVYRREWCGPLCGTGIMFLFRRRPATQWSLWSASLMWIS